jgi:hypothetical protein
MNFQSTLAALVLVKRKQAILAATGKELIAARAKVEWLRACVARIEARRLVKAVAIIALACLISGNAFALDRHPQKIGDWTVEDYPSLSDDMNYKITTASVWNYDDDGRRSNCVAGVGDCYKPTLVIVCDKDHRYSLSLVVACQNCGTETTFPVSISIDSNKPFSLQGVDTIADGKHVQRAGAGSSVDVPLNAEQVQALSQARSSILVSPLNRGPIYAKPTGTAFAFAALEARCNRPKGR